MDGSTQRNSGMALPRKATVAPAELVTQQSFNDTNVDTTISKEFSIPRDYFDSQPKNEKDHITDPSHNTSMAKVADLLHRTVEHSPMTSPRPSGLHLNILSSPMSSTDSLASLIERQNFAKINHPSHQYQLFNNSKHRSSLLRPTRKTSSNSIFNLWSSSPSISHKRTSSSTSNSNVSAPLIKSPLHSHYEEPSSRRLTTNVANPHHVHSSPNVKESKKVYLEYDPVSRKKLLNTYEIIREIGRGEHGKVKLAKDIYTQEFVAIKIVNRTGRPKLGHRPSSTEEEKVRKEIAIMKKLNHPNIVQLKEVLDDTNSRKIYLVLEYLEKGEVRWQKAPDVPFLTLPEAMQVFRDVFLGLEYLHYQGIIHRDIKPANLLIASNKAVKISDFGVSYASSLTTGEQDDYDLAKTAGTPAFFAPELCLPLTTFNDESVKHPKITHKIDIWALGVTLYCFLFGCMPFWASNEFELFKVICSKELEFPETYPSNYDWTESDKKQAQDFLRKLLDKNPATRSTLKDIKSHPFVLKGLADEKCEVFCEVQKFCDHRIEVSNDEVKVAVTGIGTRIKKGFARALKMAGLGNSTSSQLNTSNSSTTTSNQSKSIPCAESTINLLNPRRTLSAGSSTPTHRRIKSSDATETKTTVEGDLFLNKNSALSSLSHIMNDDRRRSSTSSLQMFGTKQDNATNSSSITEFDEFNESSFSKSGSQLVSLPVNVSFASLDSVYLDHHVSTYVNAQDSRKPQQRQQQDAFNKMSGFSLNKTSDRRLTDDAIAPNEPSTVFNLLATDSEDADEEDALDELSESESVDYEDDGFGFFVRPTITNESLDQASEHSVPSALLQSMTKLDVSNGNPVPVPEPMKHQPDGTLTRSKPVISGPKYSFLENSDSDSDSISDYNPEVSRKAPNELDVPYLIEPYDQESDAATSSSESDTDKLILSFGNRRPRNNTITTTPFRTTAVDQGNLVRREHGLIPRDNLFRTYTHALERETSPLAKDAPKTPLSSSNAHLLSHAGSAQKGNFVNHYHRTLPLCPFHADEDMTRGRSNSITVGILEHDHELKTPENKT